MNNDNRSPLWDGKLTFIGILSTVMIAVIFVLFNLNTKRYSDVEAAAISKSTEVTTEQQTTTTNPVEKSTTKRNIYIDYVGEEKARIAHKSYTYDKYQGIPTSVREKYETIEANNKTREEVDSLSSIYISNLTSDTPEATTETEGSKNPRMISIKAKVLTNLEEIDSVVIEDDEEEEDTESNMTYYGCLTLTAYTWTGNPCADGVYPTSGYTVACNNSDLWHKWVYIEGLGTYYVHDTGAMSCGVIDIYMDTYGECVNFGVQSANIYVLN